MITGAKSVVMIGGEVGAGAWIRTGVTMGKIEIVIIKDAGDVGEGMAVVAECKIESAATTGAKRDAKIGTTTAIKLCLDKLLEKNTPLSFPWTVS